MRQPERRAWKRSVIVMSLTGVAVAAIAASSVYSPEVSSVQVIHPAMQTLEATVITNGRVVPTENFDARASFPGLVQKVDVKVGQRVQRGQMLIEMKDPFANQRIAAAKAQLDSNEVADENVHQGGSQEDLINLEGDMEHARLEQLAAASSLTTLQQLQAHGAASDAEMHAAIQRVEIANATLRTLQQRSNDRYSNADKAAWIARVVEAREELKAQQATYGNAKITSPIQGTVYLAPVAAYDFVQMGDDLLRVADLSKMQVMASFDEPDMGKLHSGESVTILWEGSQNRVWHGHVEQPPLAAMVAGNRNVGQCIIAVDDAKEDLPPNTDVTVQVTIQKHNDVLTIPREALYTDGPVNFVYRVVHDRLVKTPVGVGIVNLSKVEITSGLAHGDEVALHLSNNGNLRPNLRVKVSS